MPPEPPCDGAAARTADPKFRKAKEVATRKFGREAERGRR